MTEIGTSYAPVGKDAWQVYYKVRNQGPMGSIKRIEIELPAASHGVRSHQDVSTILGPPGWNGCAIPEEGSPDRYTIGWEIADEADAGIGPHEELEFSLVTRDKDFLGAQKFAVSCNHSRCNYDGWTRSEGTRLAAMVPRFEKRFDMEYAGRIPTYRTPGSWGVVASTPNIFLVTFLPPDARPVPAGRPPMLDGSIGTAYPKSAYEGDFSMAAFEPISRTVADGVASLDFIATFDFHLGGIMDGDRDGTVSDAEKADMDRNSFLVEFRKKSTDAVSLSFQLTGGHDFVFKNVATGKTYAGASKSSFLETPGFWNELRIETFRDGRLSVVGRPAGRHPEVLAGIPASDGTIASFDYIKVSAKRPPGVPDWIEYRFDEFRISRKHPELMVAKLTDLSGNPVRIIRPGVNHRLAGSGFRATGAAPELKIGGQPCPVTRFDDKELVFSCGREIGGYREVTLKSGSAAMEGKFCFNIGLRDPVPGPDNPPR